MSENTIMLGMFMLFGLGMLFIMYYPLWRASRNNNTTPTTTTNSDHTSPKKSKIEITYFTVCIIGGSISGIYCAYQLYKVYKS